MTSIFYSTYPGTTDTLPERNMDAIQNTLQTFNQKLEDLSDQYVIIGGANLVLREIVRATTDIDVLVSEEVFSTMQTFDGITVKQPPERAIAQGAKNISLLLHSDWTELPISATREMGDGYFPMSYEGYSANPRVDEIEGLRLAPLDDVWESKLALQRPKDIPHLQEIARFTGRSLNFPAPVYIGPFYDS